MKIYVNKVLHLQCKQIDRISFDLRYIFPFFIRHAHNSYMILILISMFKKVYDNIPSGTK